MENDIKNLFEYLKEIYQLRTKVVSDYKKFDKAIDLAEFKEKYAKIADVHGFSEGLDADDEYFVLKYITKDNALPKVPSAIKEYVTITDEGAEFAPSKEIPGDLKEKVEKFKAEYKEAKAANDLIQKYNELYEFFFEINNRKEEFEEKIEVILGKGLLEYKAKNGATIRRHVFEAPLKIDIKQISNTIYLRLDKDFKANVEYNFLPTIDFKIKDRESLLQLKAEYEEKYLLGDKIDFEGLYNAYLNDVTFKFEYAKEETELEEEKVYIFEKDAIIVRKKQPTVWMEDLTTIVTKINNKEFAPENTLPYLILERDDEKIKELLSSKEEKGKRVLFPLPSNDEQYMVVKQTEDSNIVLVQGPPGTGKSHTIANLISNYVSEGKKILITSEKSKALEVVKGKLPEEIRDLSMAILSDNQNSNELSNSIQIVLDKYKDKDYLDDYLKRIETLEAKLDELSERKKENHERIVEALLNNSHDYEKEIKELVSLDLDGYRLINVAKYLSKHSELDLMEDENNYNNTDFDKEFLMALDNGIEDLKEYKKFVIGRAYALPEDIDLGQYQRSIENLVSIKGSENISGLKQDGIDEKNLDNYDIAMLSSALKKVIDLEKIYGREYVKENCNYKPRTDNIQKIIDTCKQEKEFYEKTETELIGNSIEYNRSEALSLSKALASVREALSNDGKLSLLEKMKLKKEIDLLDKVKINGATLKENMTAENLNLASEKVSYDLKVGKIKSDIAAVLPQGDIWARVSEQEFSRSLGDIVELLSTFNNYEAIVKDLKYALDDIFRENSNVQQYLKGEEYEKIYEEMTRAQDYSNYLESQSDYSTQIEALENKTVKTREIFKDLIVAVKEKDLEGFKAARKTIEKIYEVDHTYSKLKSKYPEETSQYPRFIEKYISLDEEDRKLILKDFDDILAYYKLKMFFLYQEINNQKIQDLLAEKEEMEAEEKATVIKTIEQKSWYHQINNMNNVTCKSLSQWLSLKTKLGKGTGKRANIIRREMQEQMQIAKDAIPIWIMPLDKVIEQYPYSNQAQFDVIIMDESSQSSVMSLTALLRGKKCIIVGDDKQISPISVGVTVDSVKDLQNKYLKDTCLGVGFDMDTSIYDLAQNVCGSKKVVLKEHFRCLPEIIEFSNIYFYGNQINCLKVRGKSNTIKEPIKTCYLEDGVVSNSSSSNLVNKKEVEKIIEILKEIRDDKTYNNKTIGIIVLQNSNAQIKAINTAVWQNFDNDFIKERRIKIGNSYEFQGDERDVIILSMVISKTQETGEQRIVKAFTTKEYERSFNVAASRGKEQMILVYSIKPSDLSNECLRYKLITYCTTFDAQKKKQSEVQLETDFERDLYDDLTANNIQLTPHFKIGKYEVDFAVNDESGRMIGIECDGDRVNTREDYEADIGEQDVLHRCGWEFIRVRASEYYYDREKVIKEIVDKLK